MRRALLIAVLLLLPTSCDSGGSSKTTTAAQPPATVPTSATGSGSRPGPGSGSGSGSGSRSRGGTLVIQQAGKAERDFYPSLSGSLAGVVPSQVIGKNTRILSTVGEAAFWAGRSSSERVLVVLRLKGEQPPKLSKGKKADFTGQVTKLPGSAPQTNDALLERQGAYVEASIGDVQLH